MSTQTNPYNSNNLSQVRQDLSKVCSYGAELKTYTYTNDTYAEQDLVQGTVMGVIGNTGQVRQFESDENDGQEIPCLILAYSYDNVAAGESITVACLIRGDIRTDKLVFEKAGDALTTELSSGRRVGEVLEDRFILRGATNATNYDNTVS